MIWLKQCHLTYSCPCDLIKAMSFDIQLPLWLSSPTLAWHYCGCQFPYYTSCFIITSSLILQVWLLSCTSSLLYVWLHYFPSGYIIILLATSLYIWLHYYTSDYIIIHLLHFYTSVALSHISYTNIHLLHFYTSAGPHALRRTPTAWLEGNLYPADSNTRGKKGQLIKFIPLTWYK